MRRTKEDSQKTRELLIQTATQLFGSRGYRQTTLLDVAREAGLTRGAMYWHFTSKVDLFNEVMQNIYRDVLAMVDQIVDSEKPALTRLDELLHCLADLIVSKPPYRAMQKLYLFREEWWQELRDIYESHNRFFLSMDQRLRQLFGELLQSGILPADLDENLITNFCEIFLSGIGLLKEALGTSRAIDSNRLIEFFLKGLTAR